MTIKDGTYRTGYFRDGSFGLRTEIGMGEGYWVSDDTGVTIEGEPDSRAIADALSLMDIESGEIVGVWTDEGVTYVDRSYHFIKVDTALRVAELFGQIAIWDCKNSKALEVAHQ
jgi:hypothetical protein